MAYETIYQFTELCYNEYIDANKAGRFQAATTFQQVLQQHLALNIKAGKFVSQRQHARNLCQRIQRAAITGNTDRLPYTGEKYEVQKRIDINNSEKLLRQMGLPEDTIHYLIQLKKENYGNEFF